jgi:hypothetical protein
VLASVLQHLELTCARNSEAFDRQIKMRGRSWIGFFVLALTSQGCSGDDDEQVVIVPQGIMTVQWSIAGGLFPSDCIALRADTFELVLFDRFGEFFLEAGAPCEAFELSLVLPDDFYNADATLVDPFDFAVTLTEPLDGLEVIEGTELVVTIDYPPGSFL